MARRNKNIIETGRGMRRGQTIVAERERMISDSERMSMRKRTKRKKLVTGILIIAAVTAVIVIGVAILMNIYGAVSEQTVIPEEDFAPTVTIEDESGSGLVTERMREFVGMLEQDFKDNGYKVARAVIPAGKTREIDIYLDGRNEYYKTSLDRGTGVTVEDALRMMRYVDGNGISPGYVDVRVPGKAFYQ